MKTDEQIGRSILERLAIQAAANRASGDPMRAEIQSAMEAYTGLKPLTAKRVLGMLRRSPLPSVRTIQEHIRLVPLRSG
jgi:hypothetical protein